MNWSIIKIQIMTVILLGGFVVLLLFKISSLFNQNEKQKVALAIVQDKNEQLEDAINTFKLNESENWVITERYLLLDQQLKKKVDAETTQLQHALSPDKCANNAIPDNVFNILQ
ncbi:DUF2570 domain-containing protein [Yersinia hibernica]|uniref:DUF2570 domain-containing protein n=1 Tax=Yersinia hibernica TaxID=2339259 RepID=A0ABX5R4I9_9GAMM|nr:DUF2570 domain-containing protein [Yersinia hibernica]QAX80559.1 DUF2570 domain-containing protein [Yersinia hibernica]